MRSIVLPLIAAWLLTLTGQASPDAGSCIASRLKAAARKTSAELKCYAAAAKHGTDVDQSCLTKAEEKFSATWSRIEASGGCAAPEDASTIEFGVISYVLNLVLEVSCGNVGSACGGECPFGLSCFSIVNCQGQVEPCRCHGSTTTCPPTSSTTSTTSTTLP
jgi:hypothetical protein